MPADAQNALAMGYKDTDPAQNDYWHSFAVLANWMRIDLGTSFDIEGIFIAGLSDPADPELTNDFTSIKIGEFPDYFSNGDCAVSRPFDGSTLAAYYPCASRGRYVQIETTTIAPNS